jgi:hypothetical protein
MIHETLTIEQLQTPEGKALYKHFSAKLLDMEHRIAFQNKVAATSFLKSLEEARVDELMGLS